MFFLSIIIIIGTVAILSRLIYYKKESYPKEWEFILEDFE